MKKKLLAFIPVIIFVFGLQAQEIQNGSFEKWDEKSGLPVGWTSVFKDIKDFVSSSKDAKSGGSSVKIVFQPQKKSDNRRFSSKNIVLSPGKYTVTLYVKGEGDIRYVAFGKPKEKTGSIQTDVNRIGTPKIGIVYSNVWRECNMSFDIVDEGDYNLHICFNSGGGENAPALLIDDISIKKD